LFARVWLWIICSFGLNLKSNKLKMRLVYSNITLSNPVKSHLAAMEVRCLVDTGSTYLCIPQHVATQLGIEPSNFREASLANGQSEAVPYGGPIKVIFENREAYCQRLK